MTNEPRWRKSSHSAAGNCAEVGAWRVSSRSAGNGECVEVGGGECVEVGGGDAVVGVRDSQLAESPVLAFTPEAWAAFTSSLKP